MDSTKLKVDIMAALTKSYTIKWFFNLLTKQLVIVTQIYLLKYYPDVIIKLCKTKIPSRQSVSIRGFSLTVVEFIL